MYICDSEFGGYFKQLYMYASKIYTHALLFTPLTKVSVALLFTATIRLSTCPLKCVIILRAFFIGVKIQIKKITLFHDKIISNKIGTMFQNFKNKKIINKYRNYVPNIISSSPFIRNAKALGKIPHK